jgi:hypothetical protein
VERREGEGYVKSLVGLATPPLHLPRHMKDVMVILIFYSPSIVVTFSIGFNPGTGMRANSPLRTWHLKYQLHPVEMGGSPTSAGGGPLVNSNGHYPAR